MKNERVLREHLVDLLRGGHAHLTFDKAIANLSPALRGSQHPGITHTPWRLVEHMRIAQWDIHQFCINPKHISPDFPGGYWPQGDAPSEASEWDKSTDAFRADLNAMIALITDPRTDLFTPLAHGEGQTLLREALLIADHNAYHLGQLVSVRKLLGAWNDE